MGQAVLSEKDQSEKDSPLDQTTYLPEDERKDALKKELTSGELDLDTQLRCGLTRREIFEMKSLGMQKPQSVPWSEWNGPKKLSTRQMFICYLAASGMNAREIAAQTGMKDSRLSLLLNSEALKDKIALIRDVQFRGLAASQQMDQLAPQAARIYQRIMTDDFAPQRLKYAAAKDVMDRKLGKPISRMELNGGSMFTEMFKFMQSSSASTEEQKQLPSENQSAREKNKPSSNSVIETTGKVESSAEDSDPEIADFSSWLDERKL